MITSGSFAIAARRRSLTSLWSIFYFCLDNVGDSKLPSLSRGYTWRVWNVSSPATMIAREITFPAIATRIASASYNWSLSIRDSPPCTRTKTEMISHTMHNLNCSSMQILISNFSLKISWYDIPMFRFRCSVLFFERRSMRRSCCSLEGSGGFIGICMSLICSGPPPF
jgi:hypothetical protein